MSQSPEASVTVRALPGSVTESQVRELFGPHGRISSVTMLGSDGAGMRALVTFRTTTAAEAVSDAIMTLDGRPRAGWPTLAVSAASAPASVLDSPPKAGR